MSRQGWEECVISVAADGVAVANTTTETIVFPNIKIPFSSFAVGKTFKLKAYGKLSTTGTPTIIFAIRAGGVAGTLIATTEAITNGSGVTNVNWEIEVTIVCRAIGSSGSLLVMGTAKVHTAAGTVVVNIFGVSGWDAPAPVTVDLTADVDLALTADWSAASASNTLTGLIETFEEMN